MLDERTFPSLTNRGMRLPDFERLTLPQLLAEIWDALERAVRDRHSSWRTCIVATADRDNTPDLRTVVLRGCDPTARTLRFHTDRRSAKIATFAANPVAALLFYDPSEKVQLRAGGRVSLVTEGAFFDEVWAETSAMSRRCYLTDPPPGTVCEAPTTALPGDLGSRRPSLEESEAGRENFTLVVIEIERFDWLFLAADGHRRAQFAWDSAGAINAQWVAP